MNLYEAIAPHLEGAPKTELLTRTDGRTYSRQSIDHCAARLANFMCSLGVTPGERVSVQVQKSVENLCLYLACLRGGFVFHPLNPAYQEHELSYFIGNAKPALIVCDPDGLDLMRGLAAENNIDHVYTLDPYGNGSLMDGAANQSTCYETVERDGDDLAALLYSSGTTGQPKGIMLTHDNLRINAQCLVKIWGFRAEDRLLHCLPIFHVHGLFVAAGCILLSGGTMRWADKFSPAMANAFLPECSVMMGVPTYYTRLLADPGFTQEICQNMRLFTSGSAPLLTETFLRFAKVSGHEILERYGMTETGMNCSNPLDGPRKPGTVGPPLPGVSARIVDASGKACARGEVGDLQVKGANVFAGYWGMQEKTAEDFTLDGFFNTGDQASMDADGYVSIVGRSKDMVITGGLNVYPKEVEDVLDQIDGVLESAVIGVPHPDFGEAVVAVVVMTPGANLTQDDVTGYAKARLANFKVPKYVHFANALPRNTMSKVQKKALRAEFGELFTA